MKGRRGHCVEQIRRHDGAHEVRRMGSLTAIAYISPGSNDERTPSASTQHHQQQQNSKISTTLHKRLFEIKHFRVRIIRHPCLCTQIISSSDHPAAKCISAPSPSSPLWPPLSLLNAPAPGTMMLGAGLTPGTHQPMLSTPSRPQDNVSRQRRRETSASTEMRANSDA